MFISTKTIQTLLFALLFISLTTLTWAKDTIFVSNAWVADAPPTSKMFAGYFTIKNTGVESVDLESVTSPKFKTIEIHQTQIINNIARMVEQDGLPIFEQETTKFAPGGLHLMMMGPKSKIKLGDKIKLTLKFDNKLTKTVTATVRKRISK